MSNLTKNYGLDTMSGSPFFEDEEKGKKMFFLFAKQFHYTDLKSISFYGDRTEYFLRFET